MKSDREWWPLDWIDEVSPPGRGAPDEFIINADGHFWLGYAFDASDATAQEKRFFSKPLEAGEVVNFLCCDQLSDVEIELHKDGTFEIVDGALDPRATSFWEGGGSDTLVDSLDEFAKNFAENERNVLPDSEWPQRLTVRTAYWSDAIPHKLAIYTSTFEIKPRFEQVSLAEVCQ